jgi:hypothetical protein
MLNSSWKETNCYYAIMTLNILPITRWIYTSVSVCVCMYSSESTSLLATEVCSLSYLYSP